ncbi:hypothetical protein N7G274_010729 [Stereocaulon virgatum]|uniref:Uncharacterized protein n=1 Tax=Stereocaulon virgatum TaxID=373712 RepID=A0ABR3ZVK0_9LECA
MNDRSQGPDRWRVANFLEQLGIEQATKLVEPAEVKAKEYPPRTPNGRVTAINEPDTGITLWGSGAIIQYSVDRYHASAKLT